MISENNLLCARKILNYYFKLEKSMIAENPERKYKYYVNTEFDSNVDDFESLSNSNMLVLTSCLEPTDVHLLMQLFHAIYQDEDNFWVIENCEPKKFLTFIERYRQHQGEEETNGYISNIQVYETNPCRKKGKTYGIKELKKLLKENS